VRGGGEGRADLSPTELSSILEGMSGSSAKTHSCRIWIPMLDPEKRILLRGRAASCSLRALTRDCSERGFIGYRTTLAALGSP
jgi:hypothetical protein